MKGLGLRLMARLVEGWLGPAGVVVVNGVVGIRWLGLRWVWVFAEA